MKIKLIDIDSKIPNLALMKISQHYKNSGHEIGFDVSDPNKIYSTVIFMKNRHKVDGLKFFYPDAEISIGGTGYDIEKKLPNKIEFLKPDYDLYPEIDYSIGYTSRGCNRNCYFCLVTQKEGTFKRWQHPSEFYDEKFNKIVFLDNNILLDKEWFRNVCNFCSEMSISVWFTQGLDIRLLTENDLKILLDVQDKTKNIEFAWDNIKDEKIILEKIKLLRQYIPDNELRRHVQFYVYIDSDAEFENGLYRCNTLKRQNINAFVMFNTENKRTQRIKDLQRWVNRKQLYWSCDFNEYVR